MPQPKKKPTDADQREALLAQVRAGSLTPVEAERQIVRLGMAPLFVASTLSRADPLLEPQWSIPMALAWITTRSPERVREASDKHRLATEVWQPLSDGGHGVQPRRRFCIMDFWKGWDQTWGELRGALVSGALGAFGVPSNESPHKPIPAYEWVGLDIVQEGGRIGVRFALDQRTGYNDVFFLSDQVTTKWPAASQTRTPKPEKAAVQKARLENALAFAKQRQNMPYTWIAKRAISQKEDYGFDYETLRKIYAGTYPAMKKHGLKGIHG